MLERLKQDLQNSYDLIYFKHTPQDKVEILTTSIRVLQFFGLPVFFIISFTSRRSHSIWREIFSQLAGWNNNYSTSFNLLVALIIFPFNVILTLLKAVLNVIKLFTEFLLNVLAKFSLELCGKLREKIYDKNASLGVKILAGVALIFVGLSTIVFHLAYFVGCATTSPANMMRSAFAFGRDKFGRGILGKIVGGILALASMFTTLCVYAVLFPLAIKLLITQAPTVLPAIANGISQFFGIFSAEAGASVAAFFTTGLPAFLTTFGQGVVAALALSLSELGATVLLAGLAVLGGTIVATVITPIVGIIDRVGDGPFKGEDTPRAVHVDEESPESAQQPSSVLTQLGSAVMSFNFRSIFTSGSKPAGSGIGTDINDDVNLNKLPSDDGSAGGNPKLSI